MRRNRYLYTLIIFYLFIIIDTSLYARTTKADKEDPVINLSNTEIVFTGNPIDISLNVSDGVSYTLTCRLSDTENTWEEILPSTAGIYDLRVITEENDSYTSVTEIFEKVLTIKKAEASITVIETELVYDGTVKIPTIITNPENLNYTIKFFNSYKQVAVPDSLGEYSYEITINDDNYYGRYSSEFIIVDKTPPVIALIGDETIEIEYRMPYEELGAIAIDNIAGNVNVFTDKGMVNTDSLYAEYIVEYSALDDFDNFGYAYRNIKIIPGDYDKDSFTDDVEDLDGNLYPKDNDTDLDGIPNYADEDDDDDGILSIIEGDGDEDCDGIVNYLDPTDDSGIYVKWGDVILIDNSKDSLVTFQWYKNDILIPNATESYYYDPQGINGTYFVMGMDNEGNNYESCHKTVTSTNKKSDQLSIFPNPAGGSEKINIYLGEDHTFTGINVFDMLGNRVLSISCDSNKEVINQGMLPTGIYIIQAHNSNKQITKKLIIR